MEPFTNPEHYPVKLLHRDGTVAQAIVTCGDETHRLMLEFAGMRCDETADDIFDAFGKIRRRLEEIGYRPLCYGAALNCYPSPMSSDMGGGVKLYRLTLGEPGRLANLVGIFDSEPGLSPVTVDEQDAFYEMWLESLR
jgi:hypothetical protein